MNDDEKAELDKKIKTLETRVAELEDQNHRLKEIHSPAVPAIVPEKKSNGITFWD